MELFRTQIYLPIRGAPRRSLAGVEVVHLDASKTSNQWARDNAKISGLDNAPIRWITEDVVKFVEKELRRGRTYHGINLDPLALVGAEKSTLENRRSPNRFARSAQTTYESQMAVLLFSPHTPRFTPQ